MLLNIKINAETVEPLANIVHRDNAYYVSLVCGFWGLVVSLCCVLKVVLCEGQGPLLPISKPARPWPATGCCRHPLQLPTAAARTIPTGVAARPGLQRTKTTRLPLPRRTGAGRQGARQAAQGADPPAAVQGAHPGGHRQPGGGVRCARWALAWGGWVGAVLTRRLVVCDRARLYSGPRRALLACLACPTEQCWCAAVDTAHLCKQLCTSSAPTTLPACRSSLLLTLQRTSPRCARTCWQSATAATSAARRSC